MGLKTQQASEQIRPWQETDDGVAERPTDCWPAWTDDVVGLGSERGITRRQIEVMAVILGSVRDRGFPPNFRDISRGLGLAGNSPAMVTRHLRSLELKGWLERRPFHRSRSLTLVHPRDRARRQLAATAEIAARFERDLAADPTYRRRGERLAVAS